MELELIRAYFGKGTNGEIFLEGKRICFTIELPWKDNLSQRSCIPEGRYELMKRCSPKFGAHIQVVKVLQRELILIHAANDVHRELKGCIAPVSVLTEEGKGLYSRKALQQLLQWVFNSLDKQEPVFITIKSTQNECD